MRTLVLAAALSLTLVTPAMAGDTALSFFYMPDRLGPNNPIFVSFNGNWGGPSGTTAVLDAGFNYQSKRHVSTYLLGGLGTVLGNRLGLFLSIGGMATPSGATAVAGPNVRLDLVGPLSLRYIGLQGLAAQASSEVDGFTHLIGIQIRTLNF